MSDVQFTERDGLVRALKITLPSAEIQTKYDAKLKDYVKTARIDGFRPGKVPVKVLEQRFGDGIRAEVLNELMQKSFETALKDHEIKMVGMPTVEEGVPYKSGEDFTFTTTFEVYPEVQLKDFSGVEIKKSLAEVTEADVANMLEKLRKQHSAWVAAPDGHVAVDGDRVLVDFEGFLNDKPFEGGKAENYHLQLGSNTMIPGFEAGLLGLKVGDTKSLNLTFPAEYHAKDLAGQATRFEVKINKIEISQLPELDDALAKKLNIVGGLQQLRQEVQKNMVRELKQALQTHVKNQVMDQLVHLHPMSVPTAMVESEIDTLVNQAKQQFKAYTGIQDDAKLPPIERSRFTEQAKRRVILGLLLSEVIRKYEIQASHEAIDAKIEELAEVYEDAKEVKTWYHSNKQAMAEIETLVLEELATAKLLEQAKVTEHEITYEVAVKQIHSHDDHEHDEHCNHDH